MNGRFAKRQMAEVHHNIKVLQSLDNDYGSIDKFLESRPINEIVKILADFKSKYKLNQMGVALVCEYLRNVGIDTAKPDKHMMRMLGCERLGISSRKKASHYEVISAFYELSRETGMWAADLDYLFGVIVQMEKLKFVLRILNVISALLGGTAISSDN